ncbi:hypothetical protein JSQ81_02405 [Sporosarcina sp. Marseille-Q4063]|uniref:hypothetical protein n=1 Tax=Sporosarcina sp. Marseille-Q4063 TaxID=2810514 RepID=UPI001BB012BE|nr:hypothetical protein [Sporosarcina sp. Marseille-Q4063]QUW22458.1 hypothetical protein JSQ81_02405 [Sporosarcina sp. Marseille-Q4063]
MKININLWSFLIALFCIPLFFIATLSPSLIGAFSKIMGFHPLKIVLVITSIAFFLGLIGLKDVDGWKAGTRSLFTIVFSLIFSGVLIFIIFFGSLLS